MTGFGPAPRGRRGSDERQLSVADPDGHSLRISCGAALARAEPAFDGEGLLPHAAYIAGTRWRPDADVHTEGVPSSAVPHTPAGHPRPTDIPLRDFDLGLSGRQQIQAVDLLACRARVRTLTGWTASPQMMRRIGYPPPGQPAPGRSPRRPVADQLEVPETANL